MFKLFRTMISFAIAVSASLVMGQMATAAPNTPQDISFEYDSPAGTLCSFAFHGSVTGNGKTIELPGNRLIFTAPKLKATYTNLSDPSKHVTLSITGSAHTTNTTNQNGYQEWVFTGRSIFFDPANGFILVIGQFTYLLDGTDPANPVFVELIQQHGKMIDVCSLIA